MSNLTARAVIELARSRHPLFLASSMPDGALLSLVDTRQRRLLLQHGGAIESLVNRTVDLAIVFSGVLAGNADGVPVYGTTYADGWAMHQTAGGVPYIDVTEAAIAGDPFGENGGTPGFPLPDDFVKLLIANCVYCDGRLGAVTIVPETTRLAATRRVTPTVFVSGNRLVPVRSMASGNSGDAWSAALQSLQLSYVALPVLSSLDDAITLPSILGEALIAGVTEILANGSPKLSANERTAFADAARQAERFVAEYGGEVLSTASTNGVQYRG